MKRVKLAANLAGLDASALLIFARTILQALTNNSNFTNPYPTLGDLSEAIDALDRALTSSNKSKVLINEAAAELQSVLLTLKAYVQRESKGDEAVAISSGFALAASTNSHQPQTFQVKQNSLSGTVDLECPFAGNKAAYVWEVTPDPINSNAWKQFKISNSTSTSLSGLTAGTKYWFRVKAIVKDKEQAYLDPLMLHVI